MPADVCYFLYRKAQVATIELIDNPGFTNDDSIAVTGEGICDRTPAVKDAILDALMDIHNCALVPDEIEIDDIGDDCRLVTDAHLEAIVTLDLSGKGLTALEAHDLAGLTSLQELYLQNNTLTTLPADVFRDLANLQELCLQNNVLMTLPTDVFRSLTALKTLDLQNNALATLPVGLLDEVEARGAQVT